MPRPARGCISSISTITAPSRAGSADDKARPENITVSVPDPQILTEHLQEAARHYAPDKILIDVAGNYERALTVAIARAHLTLIPASTTEADIYEAARIARHIQTIYAAFGKTPLYRVLATRISTLATHAQAHGFKEIARLKLPLLNDHHRPACRLRGDRPLRPAAAFCRSRTPDHRQGDRRARPAQGRDRGAAGRGLWRGSGSLLHPGSRARVMTAQRPTFRPIAAPLDVDDGALARLNEQLGVPALVKPAA